MARVSRIVGPFAAVQAAVQRHHHEQPRSSRIISPAPHTIPDAVTTGTFTRTVVWSKTPDCWLAEIRDAEGSLLGVEVAFDAEDVFLLLDEHLLPPE
jgi:hypothetical protein